MKLEEIYRTLIETGISEDVRDKQEIERILDNSKKAYEKLDESEKPYFDTEKLTNPYGDTRILHGYSDQEVRGIFCGIDMEVGEILLADRLREKGQPIDLIFAHHPEGTGFVNLHEVMYMQADLWAGQGVSIGVADALIGPRAQEVRRRVLPVNHFRAVDAARHLDLAMLCCHTPADNCVNSFIQRFLEEEKPVTLGAIVKTLRKIPEYDYAAKLGYGPTLVSGHESTRCSKIFVEMTGGTSGPADAINRLSQAGVDVLVGMHFTEDQRKRAEELKMAVIIAGHISSDNIGLNLVLDKIEKNGVEIICTSGMYRVSRN